MALNGIAALLPVLAFLALLLLMDSYKLVPMRTVVRALAIGALAAAVALGIESWILSCGVSPWVLSRYVAPLVEEPLEAAYLVHVIRRRRLGFLVDAAAIGFAVGAGFALVENLWYLGRYPDTRLALSVIRGFGPAILHGLLGASFAMMAKSLAERGTAPGPRAFVGPLLAVVVLHGLYNHLAVSPALATCVLLLLLPAVITVVFERSERATREWVGEGFDLDVDLLNLLTSPAFEHTRFGTYLRELRAHFDGATVSDMFCLLRLELELSIRAKGLVMAREAGLAVPPDPVVTATLEELRYLRRAIGPTGMLALNPLRVASDRGDWHAYLLQQAGLESRGHRVLRRLRSMLPDSRA